ncbi:AvrE-family type 3 secretion system effector [Marinomonas balearica]|uniref:Pathogenicity factor AvrE n=1 Tax=Marinomonas balearica TaxID=491947 RepID=A0A4R6M9Y5_9GAMM|nr:AvrE-family type 3 secretion system effector [Marinomonas balearica]TDO98234.1 pathogenicity factor AvrE [Marinomonas balearica]
MKITSQISQILSSHKAEEASTSRSAPSNRFKEDNIQSLADAGKQAQKPNNLRQRNTDASGQTFARHQSTLETPSSQDSQRHSQSSNHKSRKSFIEKLSCGLLVNIGSQKASSSVRSQNQTLNSTRAKNEAPTNQQGASKTPLDPQSNQNNLDKIRTQLQQPLSSRFPMMGIKEDASQPPSSQQKPKTPSTLNQSAASFTQREGKASLHSPTHVIDNLSITETGESSGIEKSTTSELTSKNSLAKLMRSDPSFNTEKPINRLQHIGLELHHHALKVDRDTDPAISSILQQTLGRKKQEYVALESHNNGQEHFALDNKGRVFQITSKQDTGVSVLHTSRPVIDPNSPPDSIRDHLINARSNNIIDKSHLAELTGIYTDEQDTHWRMSDGDLYKSKSNLGGQVEWKKVDQNINSLIMNANNQVYAIKDESKLVNVSSNQVSEKMPQNIISADINAKNEVALLLKADPKDTEKGFIKAEDGSVLKRPGGQYDGELHIRLQTKIDSSTADTLDLPARYGPSVSDKNGAKTDFSAIGFSNDHLFAIDKDNQILLAKTPLNQEAAVTFDANPQKALEDTFGSDIKYERFSHSEDGNLSVTIKDNKGQKHLCALNSDGKTFAPGWNLSDSLVLDSTLGMEKNVDESSLHIQNFKKTGALALNDKGELFAKDNLTQKWTKVDKDVSELTRGGDNNPYAVQKGEVKRVLLKEESNNIVHGDNNVFSLTQRRNTYSLDSGIKSAPSENIKSAAVLGSYKHVTLDDKGELTFRHAPHREKKSLLADVKLERGNIPEDAGKFTSIAVDKHKTLYALTEHGELYSMPENDWNKLDGKTPPKWSHNASSHSKSDFTNAHLTLDKSLNLQVNSPNGEQLIKSDSNWRKGDNTAENNSETMRDKLFHVLESSTKKYKVGKSGVAVAAEVGGFKSNQSSAIKTKFTDRLKAHIFKPDLETPRPIKTLVNSAQHNWQGRQGLQTTYQQASALFKELDVLNADIKTSSKDAPTTDSKQRISQLNLGNRGESFKKDIESFREELENSALTQLIALGKHQGILKKEGVAEINEAYTPSKLKDLKQQLNPNRSGHDLSAELQAVWKQFPASENSEVNKLLKTFTDMKLNMSHQSLDIPLGRNRDPDDKMALTKARLVLDTLTLKKVSDLANSAALIAEGTPSESQLKTLENTLEALKNTKYESNQVKMHTDDGVQSHRQAEANYDASKYLIKAMSSEDNALKVITKAALKSGDHSDFNAAFKDLMYSLKPEDNIALSRGYSGGVQSAFFAEPLANPIFGTILTASAKEKRSYDLEFDGQDDGVGITIKGTLGPSVRAGAVLGRDYLPDLHKDDNIPIPINGGAQSFKPDARVGASVSGGFDFAKLNEVKFTIKDEHIDAFVNTLTKSNAKPDDLVKLGIDQVTSQGSKWTFSVDAAVSLAARARVNLTDSSAQPSRYVRLGGGVSAASNLMSKSKEDKHYAGSDTLKERSTTKGDMLSKHSASADLALTLGSSYKVENGVLPVNNNVSASIEASVDNSVKTRGEIKAKLASEVKDKDIEAQITTLTSAFTGQQHKKPLDNIKNETNVSQQLSLLKNHFLSDELKITNDDQHHAVVKLKKIINQHSAHEAKAPILSGNKVMVMLGNTRHLDSDELGQVIGSLVSPSTQRDTVKQIKELIKNDPIIEDMISSMQTRPLASANITLELKDDIRDKAEKDYINGKLDLSAAKKLLEKPENRRLQSISVVEAGEYSEGYSTPFPLVSASSSASITMARMAATIKFEYGRDQDVPLSYKLAGDLVSSKSDMGEMIGELEKSGLAVKTGND